MRPASYRARDSTAARYDAEQPSRIANRYHRSKRSGATVARLRVSKMNMQDRADRIANAIVILATIILIVWLINGG